MTRSVPQQSTARDSGGSGQWSFQGTHTIEAKGKYSDAEWPVAPGEKLTFEVTSNRTTVHSRLRNHHDGVDIESPVFSVDGGPPESQIPESVEVTKDNRLIYEPKTE